MKKRLIGIIFLAAILVAGCSSATSNSTLDAQAFQNKIIEGGVTVLDVRTPGEFQTGHIIAAQNFDVESNDFSAKVSSLNKKATYAIYCHSGNRSALAVDLMKKAGFSSLYELKGGILTWQSAGLPLVTN
jgi:phage shock protein E